jgi:hypothetical protein
MLVLPLACHCCELWLSSVLCAAQAAKMRFLTLLFLALFSCMRGAACVD